MQTLSQIPAIRPDTLRWAIFLALLASTSALAEHGLEAATGPGGTPLINNKHGVPVIDIVAPNASGLSHNQFLDYNVARPGVVLNNALQAGQSQLAGALAANPQFQGHAASTILNEVISRNASLIEGPQEIFGRPADYILANPNGITLNGGSFINTTRAGFLVGTPELQDEQLNIRELYYPGDIATFRSGAKLEFDKAVRGMKLADQATVILSKLAPLRAKEDSPRWRAAYDLLYAQCLAYRVRLFQFILALDQHAKTAPAFKNEKSNVWNVVRTPEILPPDKQQVELTRVDLKQLNDQEQKARELFEQVVNNHPRTPWARRAQTELRWGFGMRFAEHFHDPRYYELEKRKLKLPKF